MSYATPKYIQIASKPDLAVTDTITALEQFRWEAAKCACYWCKTVGSPTILPPRGQTDDGQLYHNGYGNCRAQWLYAIPLSPIVEALQVKPGG